MQLTKRDHFQDNSLFGEQLLLHSSHSPQHHSFPAKNIGSQQPSDQEEAPATDGQPFLAAPTTDEIRFYMEFKKIYTVSHHLALEKKRQAMLYDSLNKRIKSIEDKMKDRGDKIWPQKEKLSQENRGKRARRTAEQIEKRYKCEVPCCERLYGSQGSLQQHIKLKHPELYHKSGCQSSMEVPLDSSL